MPTWELQTPDGRKFQVEAADMNAAVSALGSFTTPAAPRESMSGDELRAKRAGDTRATMRPQDIEFGYDTAQARGDRPEQQAMMDAYVKRQAADSPVLTGVDNRLRSLARGVPILGSALDEINAAGSGAYGAVMGNGYDAAYEKRLDYERARDRKFDTSNPIESTALQIGGGVASGLAAAPAALAAASAVPRVGAVAGGAATGATVGAADSFLRGEGGAANRGQDALVGGAIGGAVGGAVPLVMEGAKKGIGAIADWRVQRDTLNSMGLSKPSATVLTRALEADGSLGGQGAANIGAAGPRAMLADAGPNAQALLDTTIQRGGAGAVAARGAVEGRAQEAARGIEGAMDTAFGRAVGVKTAETAIRQGSQPARSAAYDAAYGKAIDYSNPVGREVEDLLSRLPGNAISEANRLMKVKGEKSAQILADIGDDGSVTFKSMPDVRQLDYITRALNEVADQADGQGKLGGQTAYGSAIRDLSGEIRDRLRDLVPEYGKALDTAGEAISARNALRFGEKLLSPSVARDEAAQMIGRMAKADREALKQGIRSKFDEALSNVRRTITDGDVESRQGMQAIKDLSSDAARLKVKLALGDKEAKQLFAQVDEFTRAYELKASVAQNSKTFARTALNDTVKEVTEPGFIGSAMRGKGVTSSQKLVQSLLGTGPERDIAAQDKIYNEIATILTKPRGAQAVQFMKDLQDALNRRGQGQQFGEVIAKLSGGALMGGAYPATRPQPTTQQEPWRPRITAQ